MFLFDDDADNFAEGFDDAKVGFGLGEEGFVGFEFECGFGAGNADTEAVERW